MAITLDELVKRNSKPVVIEGLSTKFKFKYRFKRSPLAVAINPKAINEQLGCFVKSKA